MNFSYSGILRIGGYQWSLLSAGHNFLQRLGIRGTPNSKVQAQGLFVLLDGSGADTQFFTNALLNQPKAVLLAGEVVFHNADGRTLRQIEFEDGLIASHYTHFEPGCADGLPALVELVHIKAPSGTSMASATPLCPAAPPPASAPPPSKTSPAQLNPFMELSLWARYLYA